MYSEEDKDIKELYGHLPYYKLFAQHQGDYLDATDWLKIVKEIQNDFLSKMKKTTINDINGYYLDTEYRIYKSELKKKSSNN